MHNMSKRSGYSSPDVTISHNGKLTPKEEHKGMRSRAGTEESVDSVVVEDDSSVSTGGADDCVKTKPRKTMKTSPPPVKNLKDAITRIRTCLTRLDGKQVVLLFMLLLVSLFIWDTMIRKKEDRFLKPDFSKDFLKWVQSHPAMGLGAIMLVIAGAVVTMIPIGTPLVLGCGYIYRGVYGWGMGLFVATVVAMTGSALGALICFLLGRYLMRERVQKWVRKYPLFDAIDIGKKGRKNT
jgi:hypothetical protein